MTEPLDRWLPADRPTPPAPPWGSPVDQPARPGPARPGPAGSEPGRDGPGQGPPLGQGPGPPGWQPPGRPPRRSGRLPLPAAIGILVLVLALAGGGLVWAVGPRSSRPTPTTAHVAAPTSAPTTVVPSVAANPRALAAGVRGVEDRLQRIRELRLLRPVPVKVVPPDQLARQLVRDLDLQAQAPKLGRQARALEVLGELPPGTDLAKLIQDVSTDSVVGFYVPGKPPAKGRLYVRSQGGLTPYTEFVLSHELTHALADQHYDLTRQDRLEAQPGADDALAAYQALAEGDATFTMRQYAAEVFTDAQRQDAARESARQSAPKLAAAPEVVQRSIAFPYDDGLRFVAALYQRGGYAAVDRAYRDPPTSSEQILHPDKYLGARDQPTPVSVPDLRRALGTGWQPGADVGVGEFDLRVLLAARLPEAAAALAAGGWDGGRLRSFQRGRQTALALRTVWDSPAQAAAFCRAMRSWATGRYGAPSGPSRWSAGTQRAELVCGGSRVSWLSAPDAGALDRLAGGLQGP